MAKDFVVTVPHSLSQEEALRRVKRLLGELKQIYETQISDVREEWSDGSCSFRLKMFVFKIQGSIKVGSQLVEVRGRMPIGTGKYEEKVKSLIESRAKALLAPKPPKPPNPLEPPRFG